MKKENCLYRFKNQLYGEVNLYLEQEQLYKDKLLKIELLGELIENLSTFDIDLINESNIFSDLQIKIVYDDIMADKIIDKLVSIRTKFNCSPKEEEDYKIFVNNLNKLINKLNLDFQSLLSEASVLDKELRNKKDKIIQYRKIQSNLKYHNQIDFNQEAFIKDYLKESDFTSEEQVLILDALRLHNINLKNRTTKNSSVVEKMINMKLYKRVIDPKLEASCRSRLYSSAKQLYINIINAETENDFIDIINYLPNYDDGLYSKDEFIYVTGIIINALIDDLNTIIDTIKDVNNYNDRDTRNYAINEFRDLYHRFCKVYFYFKESYLKYGIEDINNIEEIKEDEDVNKLIYLLNKDGVSYLERDLKDIPEEYYDRVKELLDGKKDGTLAPGKDRKFTSTNDRVKDYAKLEDDQVRIVYRLLEDNIFLILGGCVKKADRDMTGYLPIVNRDKEINLQDEEYINKSDDAEEALFKYIKENGRKGSR